MHTQFDGAFYTAQKKENPAILCPVADKVETFSTQIATEGMYGVLTHTLACTHTHSAVYPQTNQ